jgi:hypothetical protein
MQRRPALLLAALGALLSLPVPPASAADAAPAMAVDASCTAVDGLRLNRWVGRSEPGRHARWDNDRNWSLGTYPGARSTDQVVCIRSAARIVIERRTHLEVHVAAFDLGGTPDGPGDLVLRPSNSLFAEAPAERAVSRVAAGSRLKLKGATLGGPGLIDVAGLLTLDAKSADRRNVVTTRPCGASPAPTRRSCLDAPESHGTITVGDGGQLRVNRGRTTVTDGFEVVVEGGLLVMRGRDGRVTADGGTRLTLRDGAAGEPAPALSFLNNGGWYAGTDALGLGATRVHIDGALVAKHRGTGTSSIQGSVSRSGDVRADVQTGQLAIAGVDPRDIPTVLEPRSSYSTGSCPPELDVNGCTPASAPSDPQIASVSLPGSAEPGLVTITEEDPGPTVPSALGDATVIRGYRPEVSRRHPLLLELRYDASIVGAATPADSDVAVARRRTYRDLEDCRSGVVPKGEGACVDRRAGRSRVEPDGDLVMVVRTRHFSRYVCH